MIADALERNVQTLRDGLAFGRVAEHDGRAEPQRAKTAARPAKCAAPRLREKQPASDAAAIFR